MAEERPTGRLIVDILVYTAARIVLVVAVTAAIYYGALQLGFQVPLVVALLFGLIIAMSGWAIWVLRGLRERVRPGSPSPISWCRYWRRRGAAWAVRWQAGCQ
ncbi:DUF4229 domain-containing protein [Mycolicibacterium insubricum]|uniref:DUF4229 domain-containing protein n=1 Tax=Mycolicibacterium insubricum TaxID=444597 RepID=UPI0021F393EE|nr:DUF4229 domain-containing protein [Mycolicibacterium insubricum]MCV7082441.1 DUF4229 domain-containing protein [Mycolicibacterium insubricum]